MLIAAFVILVFALPTFAKVIGMAGGAYIMVRGLDNVDRGLTDPRREKLKVIFPKRRA